MYSKFFGLVLLCSLLTACDGRVQLRTGDGTLVPPAQKVQAFDGVKLISEGEDNPLNESSLRQRTYQLHGRSILLVRYESLSDRGQYAMDSKPIYLKVHAVNAEGVSGVQNHLRVCPILKNWMMMATWKRAHPFPGGIWKEAGGDIAYDECVSFDPQASTQSVTCGKENAVCFDIREWYQSFVIEQGINYGVALISDESIVIVGDDSASKGPRIQWYEETL